MVGLGPAFKYANVKQFGFSTCENIRSKFVCFF